jgi:hypothetical protein
MNYFVTQTHWLQRLERAMDKLPEASEGLEAQAASG